MKTVGNRAYKKGGRSWKHSVYRSLLCPRQEALSDAAFRFPRKTHRKTPADRPSIALSSCLLFLHESRRCKRDLRGSSRRPLDRTKFEKLWLGTGQCWAGRHNMNGRPVPTFEGRSSGLVVEALALKRDSEKLSRIKHLGVSSRRVGAAPLRPPLLRASVAASGWPGKVPPPREAVAPPKARLGPGLAGLGGAGGARRSLVARWSPGTAPSGPPAAARRHHPCSPPPEASASPGRALECGVCRFLATEPAQKNERGRSDMLLSSWSSCLLPLSELFRR